MNIKMMQAIKAETLKYWEIDKLDLACYDVDMLYQSMVKKKEEIPLSLEEADNYFRCLVAATAMHINYKWPEGEDKVLTEKQKDEDKYVYQRSEGFGGFQRDMLQEVVVELSEFYDEKPQERFLDTFNSPPVTDSEKRHVHNYIKWKAGKLCATFMSKRDKNYFDLENKSLDYEEKNDKGESKGSLVETVKDEKYQVEDEVLRDDLDDYVLSLKSDKITVKKETEDILDQYFMKSKEEIKRASHYFKNKSFIGLNPKDLWNFKLYEWNTLALWDILQKMENGKLINEDEKKDLYLFYLMICIFALYNKDKSSVENSDFEKTMEVVINKQYVNVLAVLIVKTFLYFTNGLYKKVFSKISNPPPVDYIDVKKFLSAIKYKPRDVLKKMKLPSNITNLNPSKKPTSVKTTISDVLSYQDNGESIDTENFPKHFNFQKIFESYEVFEDLVNEVNIAFEKGKIVNIPSSEDLMELLPKMSIEDLKKTVETILKIDGYSFSEKFEDIKTDSVHLTETLHGGIYSNKSDKENESNKLIFISTNLPMKSHWKMIEGYTSKRKIESLMFVSIGYGIDNSNIPQKLKDSISLQTCELLDLVDLIQDKFNDFPEEEQERQIKLIEELVTDF